ncbi:MAG: phosphotransferase [Chitinivibrionales bacterium]|nr:phosphotransferase [Chitinivibrionales bacterium]
MAKLYKDDSASPLSRPIRWYTLFNGLDLSKWYTFDWTDRVRWERDSVLFDRPGLCRAEVKGGYWDHYVLCAEVLVEQKADGWYSIQLTAGEATALSRLQPDELVVDYLQKRPLPSGDCATRVCRAGSAPCDIANGRWVELQIQVQNDLLMASVDGRRMVTATVPVGLAGLPGFIVQIQGECRVRLRSVRIAFLPPPTHAQRLVYGSRRPVHTNGRVHVPFWDRSLVRSPEYWLPDLARIGDSPAELTPDSIYMAERAANTVLMAGERVYKILSREGTPECAVRYAREIDVLHHLAEHGAAVPHVQHTGTTSVRAGHDFIVCTRLQGDTWESHRSRMHSADTRRCAEQLASVVAALHRLARPSPRCFDLSEAAYRRRMERAVADALRLWQARGGEWIRQIVDSFIAQSRAAAAQTTPCIVHGALHDRHVLVHDAGRRAALSGVVGFGSADAGYAEEDLTYLHLELFGRDPQLTNAFLKRYRALTDAPLLRRLCLLHTALIVPALPPVASAVTGRLEGNHEPAAFEAAIDELWAGVDV